MAHKITRAVTWSWLSTVSAALCAPALAIHLPTAGFGACPARHGHVMGVVVICMPQLMSLDSSSFTTSVGLLDSFAKSIFLPLPYTSEARTIPCLSLSGISATHTTEAYKHYDICLRTP